MEEIFDVFTRRGEYLGTRPKSECHAPDPGFYHKPAWIWIISPDGRVLVQLRAHCKKNLPDKWDMPSAGHVRAGETPLQGAVRETYEELGVKTDPGDYEFAGQYIHDGAWELAQIYLLRLDVPEEEFVLQPEEVAAVRWLTLPEFRELFYSDDFVQYKEDYRRLVLELLEKNIG